MKKTNGSLKTILPLSLRQRISAFRMILSPYYRQIFRLQIESSGILIDGIPWVKLTNGPVFHGHLPYMSQRFFYRYFLPTHIKKNLKEDSINVAHDIAYRYLGPRAINDQLGEGKFYNFSDGDIVVEVGAYIGFYAIRAAELVGEKGHVIAIEAVDENLKLLKKNIESNHITNLSWVPTAAWHSKGTLNFYRDSRQQGSVIHDLGVFNVREKSTVLCDTVDNILSNLNISRVDFVRIQVNGAEQEVLNGMDHTLKCRPRLLVAAIYDRRGRPSWENITDLLKSMGYNVKQEKGFVYAE
jgi:FkbM family methyltransferase